VSRCTAPTARRGEILDPALLPRSIADMLLANRCQYILS